MMFGTLAQAQHYIRTTYGDSSHAYTCLEIPFQGINQGSGTGTGIWLLVSIPIINMLKAAGFGFKAKTVISGDEFSFVCYTFVDDSDVIHSRVTTEHSDTTTAEIELGRWLMRFRRGPGTYQQLLVPHPLHL
jgi:hypothetical protein